MLGVRGRGDRQRHSIASRPSHPALRATLPRKGEGSNPLVSCGVSLCSALGAALSEADTSASTPRRPPIFMAAVCPGLLWGGTYFE